MGLAVGVSLAILFGVTVLPTVVMAALFHETKDMTPPEAVMAVGFHGTAFYVAVNRVENSATRVAGTQWVRSYDGGETWASSSAPESLASTSRTSESGVLLMAACASDGVCYRVASRDEDAVPVAPATTRFGRDEPAQVMEFLWTVDRCPPRLACVREAEFRRRAEAGFASLGLDPEHSGRVVIQQADNQLLHRADDGTWRLVDMMAVADSLR